MARGSADPPIRCVCSPWFSLLDELDTSKVHVVELLLYAALSSLSMSHESSFLSMGGHLAALCFHRNAGRQPSGCTPSSSPTTSVSFLAIHRYRSWSG